MSMYFRVTINGKRVKISGFSNKREMERIQEKVNALIMGKRIGEISPELSLWVSKLADSDSKLYDRLVELELVERRVKPGTLAELIEIL